MTLLHLPPYSPELNPMEQVWNYIKSNFLRNRVHPDVDEAQRALVEAWRIFADDPARIASIMAPQWAKA
ncbi:MAG: transposase [Rhodobacteraceae bacterium]|nr:transposase [Paracoccaceae bacterium]